MEGNYGNLGWFVFPLRVGFNFIKIRYQRDPNENWKHGLGFAFCNIGFCVYWDSKGI